MFKIISVVLLCLIAAILGFAATKPDSFRYERKIVINASPAEVQAVLNDLRSGEKWSPWEKKDPEIKRTYSGAENGVGAIYEWDGDHNVGKGRMEIIESTPEKVVTKLNFIEPFEGENTGEFLLVPQGKATEVTWAMYGPQPYFAKLMSVFINCEKMVTREFDAGLADLKKLLEQ